MNARMIFVAMAGVLFVCVPALAEWTEPVPVSEINTAYNDKPLFLSFDGLTLYFSRSETDTFNYARIYQATRPEPYGSFASVEEISTLNYSEGHVYVGWVSPDNLRMYYMRVEPGSTPPPPWPPLPPPPTGPIGRLKVTERASIYDPWLPGGNISELNALGDVYIPSLTEDELTIFFTGINLPGRQGYHIWMATRPDMNSPFGNVRNLTEINSAAGEVGPHISPDGLVLYFTSNRNGIGLCFKATRASVGDPFGNIEQLSFLDSPGSSVGNVFSSSDGTALYFNKKIYNQPWDAYVSYLDLGQIAHWKLDEGQGTTAYDSAGNNDGIIHGAAWTTGKIDGALDFDGVNDYVDCGDDISLDGINSVSVWIKPLPKSNYTGVIIDKYATNTDRWNFCMYETANGLYLWSDGYFLLRSDAGSVSPGNWHHAAITWDGSTGRMYINGTQQTETTATSFFDVSNPDVLSIGLNYFNSIPSKCCFNGLIDDIRLYNRALSVEEILELSQFEPPKLIGLEIIGSDEIRENFSADYKAIAHYDDDSTRDVTGLASWDVEPTMAASIETGVLTTKDIVEGQSATIWAGYTEGDVTVGGQKTIHIFALMGIEISGPDEVVENFSASYGAIAYYDNDSTKDVTDSASWVVEPNTIASIEAGVLTTMDIIKDELAIIWARYTEGETTFNVEKTIDIFPTCPTGTALSFDGVDDYVDCGNDISLDSINSVSLWFKAQTKSNINGIMIDQYSTNTDRWNFAIYDTATGLYLWSDGYYLLNSDAGSVSPGNWHHAVITWDGSIGKMYINGIQQTETTATSFFGVDNPKVFSIGINYFNYAPANGYFKGLIDDVRIYDRALSGEEIRANMHWRLAGDEPGLVGYWDFDEGVGQVIYDLSGNGNDGQLGSTPDIDASDPAWIESDAPMGLCTPYLIATAAAKKALKHKRASLKELEAALAQEWTMYEALGQWLDSGDFADLSKGDIVKARQKTHSAMQHEEQSIDMLGKGFEKLLDSLISLGYGPQPPGSNWPPNVTIIKPQNGAKFNPDQKIEIEADAWDYDGSVTIVEFFANGSKIGEDNDGADGWTTNSYDHPEGTYSLTAKATDDDGAATTSAAVGIMVVEEPPPPPPPPTPPPPIPPGPPPVP